MSPPAKTYYFLLLPLLLCLHVDGAKFETRPPFFAQKYAEIAGPRGLLLDEAGDILVVSKSTNNITALYETVNDLNDTVTIHQVTIVNGGGLGLNHGIAYLDNFLYASSQSAVYRWPYTPGQRSEVTEPPQTVVRDIPSGGHSTRTLIFDSQSGLYVAIGSGATGGNFDLDSSRARIRRFQNFNQIPVGGYSFEDAEIFADGVRNEVALDFDSNDTLWGIENGIGLLDRPDLGDIEVILPWNPSEEMNRLDGQPGHYGYPYCFTSYMIEGYPIGTQFAFAAFMNDGLHTDEWCRDPDNNRPPEFSMQAHGAPLGFQFYKGQNCELGNGAFPCSSVGDVFVANHGSSDPTIGSGYNVQWYEVDKTTMVPTGQFVDVIFAPNATNCEGPCLRPVNVIFNSVGHLILSSDASNEIFRVTYASTPPEIVWPPE